MAERSSSLACKKFSANVFDKNKCQNCFKPKDVHTSSPTLPQRPANLELGANRPKTTVKSGNLSVATQISTLPKIQVQKWENVWFMLYSSGVLEWFSSEPAKSSPTSLGSISMDDCLGLTNAGCETNEPYSIGIKTTAKTYYLKAENRLEMDNWCRVLKPFVIASPGYNFKTSPTLRAHSQHDLKTAATANSAQGRKSSLSRTFSAPWKASTDQKNSTGSLNVPRNRWSATEELLAKREITDNNSKNNTHRSKEVKNTTEKQSETQPLSDPALQPYFTDLYVKPEPSSQKQNGETSSHKSTLEEELVEAKRIVKYNQGKAEMCSKNLLDTKKQLEKANNTVSIQKANIEALTTEVENLKIRLRKSDEVVEKRLKELEVPTCNGNTSRDSFESGFIKLQSKLQENEKALIRRTRELEKANESRKKVAKHTRALLLELEGKLTENSGRITELEEQLMNKTLDLEYEKEERQRIEREKGQLVKDLSVSNQNSKQREVTKRSTELLQQAKEEHKHSKNDQKTQQEIVALSKQLEGKNSEISKLQGKLANLDKKNEEFRALEEAYKKANEQVESLQSELKLVSVNYSKEKTKCSELENVIQERTLKVEEKEQKTKKIQQENADLKSEIERTRKECDVRVLLLQEDNETTRIRLQEVEEELESLHTETDGRNPDFEEMSRDFEELKIKSEKYENEFRKLKDSQIETTQDFNNEKNKRLKLEKDFKEKCLELQNSQKDVEKFRELLRTVEVKLGKKSEKIRELEGICKSAEEKSECREGKYSEKLSKLEAKIQKYLSEINGTKEKLCQSNEEVLRLNTELEKRVKVDGQVLNRIDNLESSLSETWSSFVDPNSKDGQLNVDKSMRAKACVIDAVECLCKRLEILSSSLKEEKEKCHSLKQSLQTQQASARRCSACEKRRNENASLVENLQEATLNHRKELDRLQESMNSENLALKSQAEELKLKLTSKVILLQSDISELSAKHESELGQIHEQHKKEVESCQQKHENQLKQSVEKHKQDTQSLQEQHERELKQLKGQQAKDAESWREKHEHEIQELKNRHHHDLNSWREKRDSLNACNDDEIISLREKVALLEAQLSDERESNERKIETLKSEYEASPPEVKENGVVSLTEFEEVKDKHNKELEEIKEKHRLELEENKSDMMMVLQALKSDSYQSSSMSNESLEMNDELKKLEHHVETLKKEHEEEIQRLKREHEQDLDQLRSDMVTLLRVQETYKTPEEGKADSSGNVVDIDGQLLALKSSHEKELREKDARHKSEVDQLKSDMLVAIQAASAVGNISSQISPDGRVTELQTYIAKLERDFEEERENLQNAIKKAESATKFGLRRNEEMSNKIYQMQREMEEIDSKYQKEIKLYKEAFDQEKNRKTTIGAVPGILAENESLKVKLQELELSMEQMQVRYDGEIKRYKEKFQQENVLSVEELQLKIKSLEDSIEQMRIEHESELERYTKAVKRGKVSLAGTAKERDLERKIDDLESTVNVMRQKHRDEVRKYRERLEDEMERHRKEVQESRAKLRKLEADTRQMEDLKNKITDFENKTSKLTKEAGKFKEAEIELNDTKGKNRDLQRQVDALKRKVEKLEEEAEETKETGSESTSIGARSKLSRYSSLDNIGLNAANKSKLQCEGESNETSNGAEDVFEMNNNSGKSEIGGYKLNPGLKRPASVSAFPVQNENGSRRTALYNEKRRDSGSISNRTSYQPAYLKTSTSASSLK